jgi:hypothetical protein
MHQRIARTISAMATASTKSRRKVKAKLEEASGAEASKQQAEEQSSRAERTVSSARRRFNSARRLLAKRAGSRSHECHL